MTKDLVSQFHANTFHIQSVNDLSLTDFQNAMQACPFTCIRGLVAPRDVAIAKQALKENFNTANDHPSFGEKPSDLRGNFQKIAIGGKMQSGVYRPRFIRTLYNPLCTENLYQMHDIFRQMIRLRNRLLGYPEQFAMEKVEDGLWTPARIHQYPAGGGFFVAHRDSVLTQVARLAGTEFYQLLLVMTKQGEDFETGGGFVEMDDQRFIFEAHCEVGDIMIYDGRTIHGVEEIDPHKLPDLTTLSGRMVAFVTLYKALSD